MKVMLFFSFYKDQVGYSNVYLSQHLGNVLDHTTIVFASLAELATRHAGT
jgi:hypothetical protein